MVRKVHFKIEIRLTLPCGHVICLEEPVRKWQDTDFFIATLRTYVEMHQCELVSDKNPAGCQREH